MEIEKSFDLEYEETLQILSNKNENLKEFEYFLALANDKKMFLKKNNKPRVIMFSHSFPDEVVRALNLNPCYVFGGSYSSCQFENVVLPKDCNDQARSILGILKSKFFNLNKNDVVLIPYSNDNYKLIESSIRDIAKVIGYDTANEKDDFLSMKRFVNEIKRVTKELCNHYKKHLCHFKLKKECKSSIKAAKAYSELEKFYNENEVNLTLSGLVFVMNTYYMVENKDEWTEHVESLTNELKTSAKPLDGNNKLIALCGSPIYPPNYKILFEIENLKIDVKRIFHKDSEYIKLFNFGIFKYSLSKLAKLYSMSDIKIESLDSILDDGLLQGAIYHVIKGENQFSYEFQKLENKLSNSNIPIIKVETVYDYQDIEQIRLRLEAFSEMMK